MFQLFRSRNTDSLAAVLPARHLAEDFIPSITDACTELAVGLYGPKMNRLAEAVSRISEEGGRQLTHVNNIFAAQAILFERIFRPQGKFFVIKNMRRSSENGPFEFESRQLTIVGNEPRFSDTVGGRFKTQIFEGKATAKTHHQISENLEHLGIVLESACREEALNFLDLAPLYTPEALADPIHAAFYKRFIEQRAVRSAEKYASMVVSGTWRCERERAKDCLYAALLNSPHGELWLQSLTSVARATVKPAGNFDINSLPDNEYGDAFATKLLMHKARLHAVIAAMDENLRDQHGADQAKDFLLDYCHEEYLRWKHGDLTDTLTVTVIPGLTHSTRVGTYEQLAEFSTPHTTEECRERLACLKEIFETDFFTDKEKDVRLAA